MIDIDEMVSLLEQDGAECVIQYGSSLASSAEANDIDLVALYPGGDEYQNFQLRPFDVTRLSMDEFNYHRRVLNPVYCTEPCLTGRCIAGDESIVEDTVEDLRNSTPPQRAINHNFNRSLQAFRDCIDALQAGDAGYTAYRLPFVASYWLFATWYLHENPPATLDTVRTKADDIEIITEIFALAEVRKSETSVDLDQISDVVHRWQEFVLTSGFDYPTKK